MVIRLIFSFFVTLIFWSCSNQSRTDESKKPEQPAEQELYTHAYEQTPVQDQQTSTMTEELSYEQTAIQHSQRKGQALELYDLILIEEKSKENVGFVSLSESYRPNIPHDNVVFPSAAGKTPKEAEYFKLSSTFKNHFLTNTHIRETDSLFVYDYATNVLAGFAVKDLALAACISPYVSPENWPYTFENYMIGFEINAAALKKFGKKLYHTLIYAGPENPFAQEKLQPITWQEIPLRELPAVITDPKTLAKIDAELRDMSYLDNFSVANPAVPVKAFTFQTDGYRYYVRDFYHQQADYLATAARHLVVLQKKSNEVVCERIFVEGDGLRPTSLNLLKNTESYSVEQWTGNLFKNKPPVVFGFQHLSFGCPEIHFLNNAEKDIYINCDNRH